MADEPLRSPGFSTRALRAASRVPRVLQAPNAVPIYQAVTYSAEAAEELGAVLQGTREGYAYSRLGHPTATILADALAALEGAEAGLTFDSGMGAINGTLSALLGQGDHVVVTRAVYGSTRALFSTVLARFGIGATFVDPTDLAAVAAAITPRTRVLYLETISNPTLVVADLAALASLAHRHGLTVVVDNTFASPYLCRPLELGADLVIESCTKWLGGHSDVLAGAVCGSRDLVGEIAAAQIDIGGTIAPFSAFLVLRGLETLAVRMDRHCATALALARQAEASPVPRAVHYPGLPSHPQAAVAGRELLAGGGLLALDLGEREAAAAFIDALRVPQRTASLGSVFTMAVHPPSTTHRQLSSDELASAGIAEGLVRISAGLEDVEDLAAELATGLAAAAAVGVPA
ncbi:MAG TPA: aminotransferase class I/II-fold pyridoxal phosphate-dependent enzyme [Candidatus Sulfotelmatobacter sp.]|nr:aminotransferase class I/II-fold pyridoxal phosphate-dependent enzyme [Candidatus Sulfotelmatobacter sp.]